VAKKKEALTVLPDPPLPIAEAQYLLGYLKGQPFDARQTLHAAYKVADYALYQFGSVTQNFREHPANGLTELEKLAAMPDARPGTEQLLGIDWKSIAVLIVEKIITKLLGV
jgi:hypothetical protein